MTSPLEHMIHQGVRCVKCGSKGVGTCACWENCPRCGWTIEAGADCHHCAGDERPVVVAAGHLPVDEKGRLR